MKSKKEILKALRNCADKTQPHCRKCAYFADASAECIGNLMTDAAEIIEEKSRMRRKEHEQNANTYNSDVFRIYHR